MKIILAQLNYQIGNFEGNFNKIIAAINENQACDLIVFSELCLSGYYPYDLLDNAKFIESHNNYLDKIIQYTQDQSCAIIIGAITQNKGLGKNLHNSLLVIFQGKIIHTYHKKLLPTYNIFDEARHFEPGNTDDDNGIILFKNHKIGLLICEDAWAKHAGLNYPKSPATIFNKKPVDLIIAINGSPSNLGKQADRLAVFSKIAQNAQAPVLFCNQVGGYDDIVFDGGSFIVDKTGQPVANLPYFQSASGTVCIEKISSTETQLNYTEPFQAYYALPSIELIYQQILLGLTDYTQKCHFKGVIIGLSGGIDSALTVALAVKALGSNRVKAIFMPTRYTSIQSLQDSELLCQNLTVELFKLNIDPEFEFALNQFKNAFKEEANKITRQNIQARIRGRILMEYSNQSGFLVLSTGNKSELSCGYTTLYGDMTGGLNLIGDLYKTDVYELAKYINAISEVIPSSIIMRAPTAELDYNQKDADDLLPYSELDMILKLYLEGDLLSSEEKSFLESKIKLIDSALISKVHKMVDKAEFKRRQSAPIIRVQRRAFGQGRRLPIARYID